MVVEIDRELEITGRGLVFIVDLKKNGFTSENYIEKIPFELNEIITVKNKEYVIKGIEAWGGLEKQIKSIIGLIVKNYE